VKMKNKNLLIINICNDSKFISESIHTLNKISNADVLIVDDGSTDDIESIISENTWLKYIKKEMSIGYGESFVTGCEYARDMGYEIIIILNPENSDFNKNFTNIINEINYGYDIVNSSRILENYEYEMISKKYIESTEIIAGCLNEITGYSLTDPLSGNVGLKLKAIENMELTDDTHGILLQLWIQAHYFGLETTEIPSESESNFGQELELYEDYEDMFLAIIETEKYLYKKGKIN